MNQFTETFLKIKHEYDLHKTHDLICKAGFYGGCPVLKLQKPAWTNDSMDQVPNQTGIFFSIWLDENSARNNKALYNIHALKLRELKGYAITSIDFAKRFRHRFEPMRNSWPNVSVGYGPRTLMQGWIGIDAKRFERDVFGLMGKFAPVGAMIDELLESGKRLVKLHS